MTMTLEVGGKPFEQFTSAECMISMDSISRTFGFGATSATPDPLAFFRGQSCRVLIDGEPVVTGTIEVMNISGSAEDHAIDIQGRDKTSDLLDSTLGQISDLVPPQTLKSICENVIKHIGSDIQVIDPLNLSPFKKGEDQVTPDVAESAFDHMQKWSAKKEVLLTSNGDGNLFFTQPEKAQNTTETVFVRHRADDIANNVLDYSADYDSTGRYNRYIITGQTNPVADIQGNRDNRGIADQTGSTVIDKDIRLGRQLVIISETAAVAAGNLSRAQWEANVRKARGTTYQCTVRGFRNQNKELWTPGRLVYVDDVFAGISAHMRINSVIFSMGSDGFLSDITLVAPNAYTLTLEEPKEQVVGAGFEGEA